MKRNTSRIDFRYRSLLQKAIRRSAVNLVITACGFLESKGPKEKNWMRKRAVVFALTECWPMGAELVFTKNFHSRVAAMVKTSRSKKHKDAEGLGVLAHALFDGDRSVLDGTEDDRDIKIVTSALRRTDDFWRWIESEKASQKAKLLIERVARFRNIGSPVERAVTVAAAYLAAKSEIPENIGSAEPCAEFPYWLVFDAGTPQGRRALQDIARDLHIPLAQLEWVLYYFELGTSKNDVSSKWWERRCRWQFKKVGIPLEEAHLLWEPVKPQMVEAVAEDASGLHKEIYTWKMANMERLDALKKKVDLFFDSLDSLEREQTTLFESERQGSSKQR